MTLKDWLEAFKKSGIDIKGYEELILELNAIIEEHELETATNKKFREDHDTLITSKDKEINDLKDKCFRLFERQTNWDDKAIETKDTQESSEQPSQFTFSDMYDVTD